MMYSCAIYVYQKIAGKAKDITHSSITYDKRNRVFQTLKKHNIGLQGLITTAQLKYEVLLYPFEKINICILSL